MYIRIIKQQLLPSFVRKQWQAVRFILKSIQSVPKGWWLIDAAYTTDRLVEKSAYE